MNKRFAIFLFLLPIIIISVVFFSKSKKNDQGYSSSIEFLSNTSGEINKNFSSAIEIRDFDFPKDFGAHPDFMTEWWYYTGNVFTEDERHFGYQLTFFRRALSSENEENLSSWASQQIYLAHFAITDTFEDEHYSFDEMSRDSVGLAGTTIDPYFSIWLKNWEINQINENQFSMSAKTENFAIEFLLTDQKGVIFHGAKGLSQKGEEIGNASYYFSQTRLLTEGQLTVNGISYNVYGNSWMDHEFGTSTLGKNQVGWDWFSIQLENDTEIMLFQIRDRDGDISPYSSGTIISPDGSTINLSVEDFEIKPTRKWETSDQIEYPGGWDIQIKRDNIDLSISPVIPDQEMKLFFRYWEGAVVVNGFMNGEPVNGFGYVELTGYAQSMQGVF